jgi:hypothetical protein
MIAEAHIIVSFLSKHPSLIIAISLMVVALVVALTSFLGRNRYYYRDYPRIIILSGGPRDREAISAKKLSDLEKTVTSYMKAKKE